MKPFLCEICPLVHERYHVEPISWYTQNKTWRKSDSARACNDQTLLSNILFVSLFLYRHYVYLYTVYARYFIVFLFKKKTWQQPTA